MKIRNYDFMKLLYKCTFALFFFSQILVSTGNVLSHYPFVYLPFESLLHRKWQWRHFPNYFQFLFFINWFLEKSKEIWMFMLSKTVSVYLGCPVRIVITILISHKKKLEGVAKQCMIYTKLFSFQNHVPLCKIVFCESIASFSILQDISVEFFFFFFSANLFYAAADKMS